METLCTLTEFINSGITAIAEQDLPCSICCSYLTSAIRINKCGHFFDIECLEAWFKSSSKPNTCPMCREELFRKDDDLGAILSIFRAPGFKLENFNIPRALEIEIPHIEPVHGNMIPIILSLPDEISTRVDSQMASPALVIAGNTAIAIDCIRGQPLSEDDMADFQLIVTAIHTFLESKDGEKMQVKSMAMEILVGASVVLEDAGHKVDIDVLWPDDILQLTGDPARRAVQLAFFMTWIMWQQ